MDPDSRRKQGLLVAAAELRDEGDLEPYEHRLVHQLRAWFNEHLEVPAVLEDYDTLRALSWFKTEAEKPIAKMWELVHILQAHGVNVELLKTDDPRNVIYEDDHTNKSGALGRGDGQGKGEPTMKVFPLSVGPILGHTTTRSLRVWGRGRRHGKKDDPRREFGVAQLLDPRDNSIQTRFFKMMPHFDWTGVTEFSGLRANQSYRYRAGYVLSDLELDEIHGMSSALEWDQPQLIECRTAPRQNANITFIFGSCRYLDRFGAFARRGDKTFRSVLETLDGQRLHALLMAGDQIYADDLVFVDPDLHLEEYRGKYRRAFAQDYIRRLMSSVPTYMILDDHEIRNNWTRDKLNDSEENRNRFLNAMNAYQSYQVIHGPAFDPTVGSRDDPTPRSYWYAFDCGRASFFVLDTRTERSPLQDRMISPAQMRALKEWMIEKQSRVKLVVTSVPFFPDRRNREADDDKWVAFSAQRQEILEHIRAHEVQPIVFLAGDLHASGWATAGCSDRPDLKIHHLISSPFYFPASPGSSERFENLSVLEEVDGRQYRVEEAEFFTDKDNYTLVTVTSNRLRVTCFGRKNQKLGEKTIRF